MSRMNRNLSRRSALGKLTGSALTFTAVADLAHRITAAELAAGPQLKGRIRQSVCRWCYGKVSLEDLCRAAKEFGLQSIDLLTVQDFPILKKYDLVCGMVSGVPGGIPTGLNRLENHGKIIEYFERTAPIVAEHGYPNLICFSGNRKGMSDEQGLGNCVVGAKRIAAI